MISSSVARNAAISMVGKIVDETDRIGHQHRSPARELDAPRGGIERRKELVLRQYAGIGQPVEQRALAGIGVSDQRHDRHVLIAAVIAIDLPVPMHVGQLALDERNSLAQLAPVGFELCLTRTAQTDAADRLARKVSPHTRQARHAVFQLRQFHLQAAFVGLRALGEDIENQRRAVDDLDVQLLFQIALLRWVSARR